MECNNCRHEREAHADEYDREGKLKGDFTGKCLMKDDRCNCKKFIKEVQKR